MTAQEQEIKVQPQDKTVEPNQKPMSAVGWVIVVIACLSIIGAVITILSYSGNEFKFFNSSSDENEEETEVQDSDETAETEPVDTEETTEADTTEPTDTEDTDVAFTGTYLLGEAPEGWTIVEHANGEGSDMLTEGVTYTGLTGLEILNPASDVVFSMKGIYGIGGTNACSEFYHFVDTSDAYQTETVNTSQAEGVDPVIVEIGDSYVEYFLFGLRLRRVATTYYNDVTPAEATFDAGCGINALWSFIDLSFDADGTELKNYNYTVLDTATDADLLILDSILQSLTVI